MMASVVGKTKKKMTVLVKIGRCLRGWVDGRAVYRYVKENPRSTGDRSTCLKDWIEDGYFSKNLLDE
jgi:hypothetical protein